MTCCGAYCSEVCDCLTTGAIAQKVERNDARSYPESMWTKGAPRGVVEVAGSIPAGSD